MSLRATERIGSRSIYQEPSSTSRIWFRGKPSAILNPSAVDSTKRSRLTSTRICRFTIATRTIRTASPSPTFVTPAPTLARSDNLFPVIQQWQPLCRRRTLLGLLCDRNQQCPRRDGQREYLLPAQRSLSLQQFLGQVHRSDPGGRGSASVTNIKLKRNGNDGLDWIRDHDTPFGI